MSKKIAELEGTELDAAVAKAEGYELDSDGDNMTVRDNGGAPTRWNPSTNWLQGGGIIDREHISVQFDEPESGPVWLAFTVLGHEGQGPTALMAAMRAYVASKT